MVKVIMVQIRVTDPNFLDVTKALNKSGIPYFIGGGTLLRLYRDGDFAAETGDIDFYFRGENVDKIALQELLLQLTFLVVHSDPQNLQAVRDGGRKVDFNFLSAELRECSDGSMAPHEVITWIVIPRSGLFGMLYFKWNRVANIVSRGGSDSSTSYKRKLSKIFVPTLRHFLDQILWFDNRLKKRTERNVEYRIPSDLLETELVVSTAGSWYQPIQVESVLENLYGPNWRTPLGRKEWFDFAKDSPEKPR